MTSANGRLPLLAVALLAAAAGCDGAADVGMPPVPPADTVAVADPGPPPPVHRDPLPEAPADEGERRRGLLRWLEQGDTVQVRFAQEVLAADPEPDAAAEALRAAGEENLRRNTLYVCNLVGAIRSPDLARPLAPFLMKCIASEDPGLQRLALQAWVVHVPRPDVKVLARLGGHGFHTVALDAVEGLRRVGTEEAMAALREAFPDLHPAARSLACVVLGDVPSEASTELLRGVLESTGSGDPEVSRERLAAAAGLAALGREEGVEVLRRWVESLEPDLPPGTAEDVLSRRGDDTPLPRLLALARTGAAPAAVGALELLPRYAHRPEATAAAEAALKRTEMEVILEAFDALRRIGDGGIVARALAALRAPEQDRRYAVALVLGRWKDPSTVEPLCRRLAEEPSEGVRAKIGDALGLLADARAAPALVAHLLTETATAPERAFTAYNAAFNLRGVIAPAAAPLLMEHLRRGIPVAPRCHALTALGAARGVEGVRETLERFLGDADGEVRRSAALALGDLRDPAARPALEARHGVEPDDGVADAIREAVLRIDLSKGVTIVGR